MSDFAGFPEHGRCRSDRFQRRRHLPPGMETPTTANEIVRLNDVVYSSRLGGLLNHYERRAA